MLQVNKISKINNKTKFNAKQNELRKYTKLNLFIVKSTT